MRLIKKQEYHKKVLRMLVVGTMLLTQLILVQAERLYANGVIKDDNPSILSNKTLTDNSNWIKVDGNLTSASRNSNSFKREADDHKLPRREVRDQVISKSLAKIERRDPKRHNIHLNTNPSINTRNVNGNGNLNSNLVNNGAKGNMNPKPKPKPKPKSKPNSKPKPKPDSGSSSGPSTSTSNVREAEPQIPPRSTDNPIKESEAKRTTSEKVIGGIKAIGNTLKTGFDTTEDLLNHDLVQDLAGVIKGKTLGDAPNTVNDPPKKNKKDQKPKETTTPVENPKKTSPRAVKPKDEVTTSSKKAPEDKSQQNFSIKSRQNSHNGRNKNDQQGDFKCGKLNSNTKAMMERSSQSFRVYEEALHPAWSFLRFLQRTESYSLIKLIEKPSPADMKAPAIAILHDKFRNDHWPQLVSIESSSWDQLCISFYHINNRTLVQKVIPIKHVNYVMASKIKEE